MIGSDSGRNDDERREESLARPPSAVPLWIAPVVVIGGSILVVALASGDIQSFYFSNVLPFLVATWIGLGFNFAWDTLRYSMKGEHRVALAAAAVLSALVLLSMLGGVSTAWEDPWLFGVAVAPGFRIALAALRAKRSAGEARSAAQSGDSAPGRGS